MSRVEFIIIRAVIVQVDVGRGWAKANGRRSQCQSPLHFIFMISLYVQPACYIILMSFSNYVQPFFTAPCYSQIPLCQLPWFGFFLPDSFTPFCPQQVSHSSPQQKTQFDCDELDFKNIEQNLRLMHFSMVQHKKTHWTDQEDKLLQKLIQVQKLEWKQIPKFFEERTQNMCYSRYRRISMSIKDRNWNRTDEELVSSLVAKFGEKWKLISSKIIKFTPKQIRQRYLNYIRPNINKEEFDFEEDLKICRYVLTFGKHWRKMQELLPGRPQGCIKGRYYGKLQKIIQKSTHRII